jgi:hypothetical protein
MIDSVLQNSNLGGRSAKPLQPRSSRRRFVCFGAQKDPIDRRCLGWICERAQRNINSSIRMFENQMIEWASDTCNDIVLAGVSQTRGYHAAYTAEPYNGYRQTNRIGNSAVPRWSGN